MTKTMYNPASPGELLREFMGDHPATELAEHIGVAPATISRLLNGRTAVTMDLSIRLGEAFSLSPDFFLEGAIAAGFVGSFAAKTPEDQAAGCVRGFPLQPKEGLHWALVMCVPTDEGTGRFEEGMDPVSRLIPGLRSRRIAGERSQRYSS
ncbi:MAG: HigA family addiction module antitoxin [Acidobacteriota bacterium]